MLEASSKPCKKCGETKLLTAFGRCDRARDGRVGSCNACAYQKRPKDQAKQNARTKAWREANPDRHRELKRAESKRRTVRKAEAEGREYVSIKDRLAAALADRDRIKAQRNALAAKLRADRIAAKPWLKPGLNDAEKWALRYKIDADFNLRERMRTALRHRQNGVRIGELMRETIARGGRSRSIERKLGYSIADLIRHLEKQFSKGMAWSAFLSGDIHIDHRLPMSSFDLSVESELRAAWALTNLQPMWATDNIAKGARRTFLL